MEVRETIFVSNKYIDVIKKERDIQYSQVSSQEKYAHRLGTMDLE